MSDMSDGVHGNVAHTMGRVHGHVAGVVQGVHHLVLHHLDGVEGHVGEVVDHVGHHAHDVVVGVVGWLGGAQTRVLLGAGGATGAVRTGGAGAVDLSSDDVPRLPVVADVQSDVELSRSETTRSDLSSGFRQSVQPVGDGTAADPGGFCPNQLAVVASFVIEFVFCHA